MKEILFRAAERTAVQVTLVANRLLRHKNNPIRLAFLCWASARSSSSHP
jgi:uncharacterized protein YaiI (UPF0178 family)